MDKNSIREQLEARNNFIATFEIAAKPGHYRCLLETPAGQLFWHDVGKENDWRWGICECYGSDDALKTMVTDQYYNLVKGVLPWERKSKGKKVDESKIESEANRILGIVEYIDAAKDKDSTVLPYECKDCAKRGVRQRLVRRKIAPNQWQELCPNCEREGK